MLWGVVGLCCNPKSKLFFLYIYTFTCIQLFNALVYGLAAFHSPSALLILIDIVLFCLGMSEGYSAWYWRGSFSSNHCWEEFSRPASSLFSFFFCVICLNGVQRCGLWPSSSWRLVSALQWLRGYKGLQGWPTARVSGWWQLAGETKSTSVENWN